MLKRVAGLVAGATLLTVGTVSAFASSQGNCFGGCQKTRVCDTTNCSAQCYVDQDGDGVCDNRGLSCDGRYYVDVDNDGVCDNRGANCNGGANCVDTNGDGVCDNCGAACNTDNGQNYVDDNGEGVCDNWGTGGSAAHGCHGNGHGAQHGHSNHE